MCVCVRVLKPACAKNCDKTKTAVTEIIKLATGVVHQDGDDKPYYTIPYHQESWLYPFNIRGGMQMSMRKLNLGSFAE